MTLSEALEAVGKLIATYPNGSASAGKSYIGALASLLCSYPKTVAMRCSNPTRGVATTTKFLPTIADVVAWCEPEVERLHGLVRKDERIAQQLQDRAKHDAKQATAPTVENARYNLLVRYGRPGYERMCAKAEKADPREFKYADGGIWVPLSWWNER